MVISIPLSNRVIFIVCFYAFLNCSSSHMLLGSVSFKNNFTELWKRMKKVSRMHGVDAIPSFMGEGFSHDLLQVHAFCFPHKEIK